MDFKPHSYQLIAVQHLLENNKAALFLDMGLGKSVTTLTTVVELIQGFEVGKVLIVAPKLVAEHTWKAEIEKWAHTKHLTYSVVAGTAAQRKMALMRKADIYMIGRDNVAWLVDHLGVRGWDFDMLVIDELTSFKNSQSRRFKALRKVAPLCHRVVGLTGTPAPNSLEDLWAQLYLLDRGDRLGMTLTRYRDAYFKKKYNGFGYELRSPECADIIHDRVRDICLSMQAKDYLDMPRRVDVTRKVRLARMDKYLEFVREEVLKLEDALGGEITPMSAGALYSKLLQFCNGAVYDENKNTFEVDSTKVLAIQEAVEELQGQPCLVFYQFRSDIPRLLKALPGAEVLAGPETIDRWNRGDIKVLLMHAASAGHGLNMQAGGHHIFWFGLPWALELYQQAVARLDRQGQQHPVINVRFVCEGTVEELVEARLAQKAMTQDELFEALKRHIQ